MMAVVMVSIFSNVKVIGERIEAPVLAALKANQNVINWIAILTFPQAIIVYTAQLYMRITRI